MTCALVVAALVIAAPAQAAPRVTAIPSQLGGSSLEAVKGQAVAVHANAPGAAAVRFALGGEEQVDSTPPFEAFLDTDRLSPGTYPVETSVYAPGDSSQFRGYTPPYYCSTLACVGKLEVSSYCRSLGLDWYYYDSNGGFNAAYSWSCGRDGTKERSITASELTAACQRQFGGSVIAASVDSTHSSTWYCYAVSTPASGPSGEVRIFPVTKVRPFKASVLVVAGTERVVGLHVSGVERDHVVRAWFHPTTVDEVRVPLGLRAMRGRSRTYGFRQGFALNARGDGGLLDVEVAPPPGTLRHGAEVQGRMSALFLRTNSAGEILVNQSRPSTCTVWRGDAGRRSASQYPSRRGNCRLAPTLPTSSVFELQG